VSGWHDSWRCVALPLPAPPNTPIRHHTASAMQKVAKPSTRSQVGVCGCRACADHNPIPCPTATKNDATARRPRANTNNDNTANSQRADCRRPHSSTRRDTFGEREPEKWAGRERTRCNQLHVTCTYTSRQLGQGRVCMCGVTSSTSSCMTCNTRWSPGARHAAARRLADASCCCCLHAVGSTVLSTSHTSRGSQAPAKHIAVCLVTCRRALLVLLLSGVAASALQVCRARCATSAPQVCSQQLRLPAHRLLTGS
jgi:hypothetical protein